MKKIELIQLGLKLDANYLHEGEYFIRITETYKYRGEIKSRTYLKETEKWWHDREILDTPAFICPECRKRVSYNELESWLGDNCEKAFLNNLVVCSNCYEDEMGEDL